MSRMARTGCVDPQHGCLGFGVKAAQTLNPAADPSQALTTAPSQC